MTLSDFQKVTFILRYRNKRFSKDDINSLWKIKEKIEEIKEEYALPEDCDTRKKNKIPKDLLERGYNKSHLSRLKKRYNINFDGVREYLDQKKEWKKIVNQYKSSQSPRIINNH
jgi:hypothetical protein